jgi:hypothetical protein
MGSLAVKPTSRFFRYAVVSTPGLDKRRELDTSNPYDIVQRLHDEVNFGDVVIVEVDGYLNSIAITHILTMWRQVISRNAEFRCVLLNQRSWIVVQQLGLHHNVDFRMCPRAASHGFRRVTPSCDVCLDAQRCKACHSDGVHGVDSALGEAGKD